MLKIRAFTKEAPSKKKAPKKQIGGLALWLAKGEFARRRADFYDDLAESLDDRAVLVTVLDKHLKREKKKRSGLAGLYQLWLSRMDSKSFAQSLKGTVPDMDNMILIAADTSGKLPEGLRFLAESVRSVEAIKGALIGAVAIPVLISSMMVGMVYGFGKWMVPILTSIIPVEHWPSIGQWMYHISSVLVKYGPSLLGGLTALAAVFIWSLSNWTGNLRVKFDNYLPYALYRDYNGALMLVSMGGLMQANSSLAGALRLLKTSATPWMTWHLTKILRMLDKESSEPVKAFDTGVLPLELYERVADYGERSGFQNAMSKIGSQSLERVRALVQKRAKVLNNILLVFTGLTLALMISSVMLTAQSARTEVMSKMNSVR